MIKTASSFIRALLAALLMGFLFAGCGGGVDEGPDSQIPTDAKACVLKQVHGSDLLPHFDVEIDGLIPGTSSFLRSPRTEVAEGLVFTVDFLFPAQPPLPETRSYVFYTQEYLYHVGDAPRYQCVLTGLQSDDRVYLSGGKEIYTRLFFVDVWMIVGLSDGRTAASPVTQLLIEY